MIFFQKVILKERQINNERRDDSRSLTKEVSVHKRRKIHSSKSIEATECTGVDRSCKAIVRG